jgi:hypothetical protein
MLVRGARVALLVVVHVALVVVVHEWRCWWWCMWRWWWCMWRQLGWCTSG